MAKLNGTMGIVFMLLTIAVAGVGAAYALWFQDISIAATVETDTVGMQFSNDEVLCEEGLPLVHPNCTEGVTGSLVLSPFTNDDGEVNNLKKDPYDADAGFTISCTDVGVPYAGCTLGMSGSDVLFPSEYDRHVNTSSSDPSGPALECVGVDDPIDACEAAGQIIPAPIVYPPKDVGICTVEKKAGDTVLNVTLSDTYPSYWCTAWYHPKNTGSVPAKLQDITLTSFKPGGITQKLADISPSEWWCVDNDGQTAPYQHPATEPVTGTVPLNWCPHVAMPLTEAQVNDCSEANGGLHGEFPERDLRETCFLHRGPAKDQLPYQYDYTVHISELECGVQVDPDGYQPQGNIDIHLEQGAAQGLSIRESNAMRFQVVMKWVQWNEFDDTAGVGCNPPE